MLETSEANQCDLDVMYTDFVKVIKKEMCEKLPSRNYRINSSTNNKRRRCKKPWWNMELTELWNEVCVAETSYLKADRNNQKQQLRHEYVLKRKKFDKKVQQCKRSYWYQLQEDLTSSCSNPKEFWRKIGKIGVGAERQRNIPMEIKLNDGSVCTDRETVLNKWKNDFSLMLNIVQNVSIECENNPIVDKTDEFLDCDITIEEVFHVLKLAKNGKSPGIDELPVELLKNPTALSALVRIFNVCFSTGKVPNLWSKGVITPIPKSSTSDPSDPLSYRGITLAPATYKLYCGVLDLRLSAKLDTSDMLHDEQNGFRRERNTVDHLSSITSIIETRKLRKLSTFAAFIDFKKAYDSVNRFLLFKKLEGLGISSKMIRALRSLYNNVQSCIKLNGFLSGWFSVNNGLKQGCVISPLLFNIFINDLIDAVKKLNVGIDIGNEKICILLYADDVVFLSENENDLQKILNTLECWCCNNDINVNLEKSKIVHFRSQSTERTNFSFVFNGLNMEIVSSYTYLGLLLTEFLSYEDMAKAVAKSAGRALGLLISKYKAHGGFQYDVFTKLFDSVVWSVIDYGASIWGTREFSVINAVKNRAMRFFMGVGRYTPNLALYGDMGWKPCIVKQWSSVFRVWSRFSKMSDCRINKKIFLWSNSFHRIRNWNFRVQSRFKFLNLSQYCNLECILGKSMIKYIENIHFEEHQSKWKSDLFSNVNSKLRTYRLFKSEFCTEKYLRMNFNGNYRSALAKFRAGVAPLRIETGRYEKLDICERVCFICKENNLNVVEDEKHVLINCPGYADIRINIFNSVATINENFITMSDDEKFLFLFHDENVCFYTAKICNDILFRRRCLLYS